MLDKTYNPAEIEARIHREWEKAEAFRAGRTAPGGGSDKDGRRGKEAKPYCIVIPPPNVTGSLHMGHALNNTLQDILCRFERMRGRDVLWQPGTDHAGIATQMVVERQLAERQQPDRRAMGRDKFVETIWKWKAESGGTIINQLKRLGASCDWSRERFTMDEGLSKAVLKVFVELYRKKLIYKDKRLVNWDPHFQTAISDLEVEQREVKGHLWHFKYPLKDYPTKFIVVATTRPETMLGDTAVAVHPDDKRYRKLIGKTVVLPLVGREIPIVADEYSDPEKGSGAVKITPAHDFNDFEVGRRHSLPMVNVLDAHACINDTVPEKYRGLDRFEARKRVVADLEALGLVDKIEPHTHAVPHGDRSGVPIEPWLTDQWYVDAETLAKPALKAVKSGKTKFVPERFANDYYRWMENIEPWCISRQLWWGHQIPAWYGPKLKLDDKGKFAGASFLPEDLEVFCYETEGEAIKAAEALYGTQVTVLATASDAREEFEKRFDEARYEHLSHGGKRGAVIFRDPDVLDTWFSSALWPFSTLGWPEETPELARYYPTDVLVTGFDIIFFWVARMMMMGLEFQRKVPFHTVYIHGLVRDGQGQKMSKSKGNVMDPLDLIDGIGRDELIVKRTAGLNPAEAKRIANETKRDYPEGIKAYGADALRFSLAAMASQGSDVKFSVARIEGYRNFATKLWNACRFAEMNGCKRVDGFNPKKVKETVNRWIAGETERTAKEITTAIEEYKFNEAAGAIYRFVWNVFCDWYLELVKPVLDGPDGAAKAETRACVAWTIDRILALLHPFMPFLTEELWSKTAAEAGTARETLLALADWPALKGLQNEAADAEIGWVIRLVSGIRSVRTEMNVPAAAKIDLVLTGAAEETAARCKRHEETIKRLARLERISLAATLPKGSAQIVVDEATAALPLAGVIDLSAERARLAKEIERVAGEIQKIEVRFANKEFVAKAPEHVIAENRERLAEFQGAAERLGAALKRLEAAA